MCIKRIQHNSEIYIYENTITNVYKNTLTSVVASMSDNHHLRSIVMIQRYSTHAAGHSNLARV